MNKFIFAYDTRLINIPITSAINGSVMTIYHHDKNISNYFSALYTILLHFFLLYVVAITNEIQYVNTCTVTRL